tara:strand:+ start:440 stop:1042 length:603 start_codon:yes stop_codon:yes gene_type:complete
MKLETIEILKLAEDPNNARFHNDVNIRAIKGSLAKFGQQKPIVIDKNNVVIAGNGTLRAAMALGWTKLSAVRTDLEGYQAMAYALADNKASELASWDLDVLNKSLSQLIKFDSYDFTELGFDIPDIGVIQEIENQWEGMPEFDQQDKMSFRQIKVHFRDIIDVEEFEKLINQKITPKTKSIWHPKLEIEKVSDKRYESES